MSAKQRHTKHFPCPRCGSYDEAPRGKGIRCSGFTVGEWAHCSRDELAGTLRQEAGGTYCHRMEGDCRCGLEHNGYRPTPISIGRTARTKTSGAPEGRIVVTHEYRDDDGSLGYQVLKYEPKDFRQRRPDGTGGWVWNLEGVKRLLYRQPELIASTETTVYYSTSEKDVDRLISVGLTATCNSEGDGKWQNHFVPYFAGLDVVFLCHNDPSGIAYGDQVAAALCGFARSVKVVRLPGLLEHGDISDWFDASHSVEDLEQLVDVWPEWRPAASPHDSAIADALASIERDLAAAQAQLIKQRQYTDTVIAERGEARKLAEDRRHELMAIRDLCESKDLDPQYKMPAIRFFIAGKYDPEFREAYDRPVDLYYSKVTEMTGIKDGKTIKKVVEALDAGNLITRIKIPCPTPRVNKYGKPIEGFRYQVQFGPREGEAALDLTERAKLLCHPTKDELRPKGWGQKRPDRPRCETHPDAPLNRKWFCSVDGALVGEDTVAAPPRNDSGSTAAATPRNHSPVGIEDLPGKDSAPLYVVPNPNGAPTHAVCNCGTALERGEACAECEMAACRDCGSLLTSTPYRYCRVPCTRSAPEVYTSPPAELVAAYGSVGAAG